MSNSDWKPPVPFKVLTFAAIIFSIIYFLQDLSGYLVNGGKYDLGYTILYMSSEPVLWLLLCKPIYKISHAYLLRFKSATMASHIFQFSISLFIGFFQKTMFLSVQSLYFYFLNGTGFSPFDAHPLSAIITTSFNAFIIYWIIAGAFFTVDYYRRFNKSQLQLSKAENDLNNAQLSALQMQLNPHFLFNTLHTISSLMGKNDQGQKVLSRLGHLLRSMLEQDQKHTVTLRSEVDYIKSYLYIEEVRFQDRLEVSFKIPEHLENALVPNLILQPLVENAIKHGFSKRMDSGKINICAHLLDQNLELYVEDDGKGVKDPTKVLENPGIGISNIHKRLKRLYNDSFSFVIESPDKQGFTARITLPFIETKDA